MREGEFIFAGKALKSKDGFTLIETLVSIMVLAICMTVILQLFSGGLKSNQLADDYTRAIYYAREKMDEILLLDSLIEEKLQGSIDDRYQWQAVLDYLEPPEDEEKPEYDMFQITVTVFWSDGERKKQFEISTLKIAERIEPANGSS